MGESAFWKQVGLRTSLVIASAPGAALGALLVVVVAMIGYVTLAPEVRSFYVGALTVLAVVIVVIIAASWRQKYADLWASKFPSFTAGIIEIIAPDPPLGPDMFAAIVVSISNEGAPSAAHTFRVAARLIDGTDAEIVISAAYNGFSLILNGGRARVDYTPEHYLFNRTIAPIEKGAPVLGVLPCSFRRITDINQVELTSIRVSFKDYVPVAATPKIWETQVFVKPTVIDNVAPQQRPSLPPIREV